MVFHDRRPLRTHDLTELIGEAIEIVPAFELWMSTAEELTPYAIQLRYPGELLEPEEKAAIRASEQAEALCEFIRQQSLWSPIHNPSALVNSPMSLPTSTTLPPSPPGRTGWPWTEAPAPLPPAMPDGAPWPRISIVTPSYNQGQFIEETIRSVLLQGYPNLEYIIVDGGSSDESAEIIQKYEPWITHWESKKDRGQSHAINKGFARATGQIMAWLNSDDVYLPGALREVALQLAHRQRSMVVGAAGHASVSIERYIIKSFHPEWKEMAYGVKTFAQPSVFWTRDLWKEAGRLNEAFHLLMDTDLWLRLRHVAESVVFIDKPLSIERMHERRKSALHDGDEMFHDLRLFVSLQNAQARGESRLGWLLRVWALRASQAWRHRHVTVLLGPGFHQRALQYALRARAKVVR